MGEQIVVRSGRANWLMVSMSVRWIYTKCEQAMILAHARGYHDQPESQQNDKLIVQQPCQGGTFCSCSIQTG
jgi:hypothetical protein